MNCSTHAERPVAAYCRTCGKALCEECKREVAGVVYCEPCIAARMQPTMPTAPLMAATAGAPNPGLALGLGFIPGVGAMYNGQVLKGFVHVGIFALIIALTNQVDWFGFFIPIFIFYMAMEAYQTARAKERGLPPPDYLGLNALLGTEGEASIPPPAAATAAPTPGASVSESEGAAPPSAEAAACCPPGGLPIGAIVLIILGGLFLMDNLHIFDWRWMHRLWPLILIAVGVHLLMRRNARFRQP